MVDAFLRLAHGDFDARLERTDERDDDDTLAYLFNVLAEELGAMFEERQAHRQDESDLVSELNEVLTRVAGGDFDARAPRRYDGGHADALAFLVNATTEELAALFVQTQEQRAEIERQAQEHLAERMAAVSTLGAGVAHELNNPLAFVRNNTEFLRDQLKRWKQSGEAPEIEELLAAVDETMVGVDRATRIVGDLKELSPLERTRLVPVDLAHAVGSSLAMTRRVTEHRAELRVRLRHGLVVNADAARLGQVLINLVQNAVKAFGDRPRSENEVQVRVFPLNSRWVAIDVDDNGPGVDPELQHRIFDAFFTTGSVGSGTGLGLSISHRLVEDMGGTISVQSEPGHGTRFRIRLPRCAGPASKPGAAPRPPERSWEVKVQLLLIDDEELLARAIQRGLRSRYDVQVATSGEEGIALALGGSFDVVLCDLMLPDVDGMGIRARLLAERPELAERMLFMTGGAFTKEAEEFLQAMGPRVIRKPFSMPDLLARLESVLA